MIGQIIGNYKIEKKLGEGGMGAVYKGVDTMLDREVAIKALRPELASQTSVVDRFRSEAVTLAKLNHPNIATLYTMFRQGNELYMVIEYVRGETLDTILQRRGALPPEEAIPVFCQVLDGIDHAHELGVVHRDIKPANIMLTERGTLKVLDFGIARLLGSARMTRAGNIIGTLEYMSPEQVKGLDTDARSDIYALGMMLYEMLTGKTPFDSENEFELMKLQTEAMPVRPAMLNRAITAEVEAAIYKAIQKDPNARFQTAGEFRETLLNAGFSSKGVMHGATNSYTGSHNRYSSSETPRGAVTEVLPDKDKTLVKPFKPGDLPTAAFGTNAFSIEDAKPSGNETAPLNHNSGIKETVLRSEAPPVNETATAKQNSVIKETKLGSSVVTNQQDNSVPKETRLGSYQGAQQSSYAAAQEISAASFFSRLKPVHYIGAGVAAVVLLGLVILVPAAVFMMRSKNQAEVTKPEAKPKVEASQAPVIETPKPTPREEQASAPISTPTLNQDPGELTPVDDKPVASRQVEKPVTVKKVPTPKPPTPGPNNKNTKRQETAAERDARLERLLTGKPND